MAKRKLRLDDETLVIKIVNKQLKPFGVTINDIKDEPDWYLQFEVSEKEQQEWIDWGIDFIFKYARNPTLRTKRMAKREMGFLNLNYGLKIKDNKYKKTLLIEKFIKNERKNKRSS